MVEIEKQFDDYVSIRCHSITENLLLHNLKIKSIFDKISNIQKNSNEYFKLHSDMQEIIEKEIYKQAFKDGVIYIISD